MHQDRDGRLAVEIIGHAGGAIGRGRATAMPDSGKEVGKSCAEHGGKSAIGPGSKIEPVLDHIIDADQSRLSVGVRLSAGALPPGRAQPLRSSAKMVRPRSPAK